MSPHMLSKRGPKAGLIVPQKTVLTEVDVSRHSGRVRMKPLEFWNFERVEVLRTDDGKLQVIHYKLDLSSPEQSKRGMRTVIQPRQTCVRRKPTKKSLSSSSYKCPSPVREPQSLVKNKAVTGEENIGYKKENADDSLVSTCSIKLCDKLSAMTLEDMGKQSKALFPFLRRVIKGQESNERHNIFLRGGRELREMKCELIYDPYSEDQILYVIDMLTEQFSAFIRRLYGKDNVNKYIWKVLAPTLFIRIVMEKEGVPCSEAEQLLIKTSLRCI